MAIFYRGAGIGTYWHERNACRRGFRAKRPKLPHSLDVLKRHIANGSVNSPYISLTKSFAIALEYALNGRDYATEDNPAFVYEVRLDNPLPECLTLYDPVYEICVSHGFAAEAPYHHNGNQQFLLGLIADKDTELLKHLEQKRLSPYPNEPQFPVSLSDELKTVIRALRDAEILVSGTIPNSCIDMRHPVTENHRIIR